MASDAPRPTSIHFGTPPPAGGFWNLESKDDLRDNLLGLLREAGLTLPTNPDSKETMEAFLTGGFFLVQAMKWPFAKGKRKQRPNFNQVGPRVRRRLSDHTVSAHLRQEVAVIAPSGILAMGNAAWQACIRLPLEETSLPQDGVETVRGADYQIRFANRAIPLNATLLPVGQNMRHYVKKGWIMEDFRNFLNRHAWNPERVKRV